MVKPLSAKFNEHVRELSRSVMETVNDSSEKNINHEIQIQHMTDLYLLNKSKWVIGYDVARYLPEVFQIAFSDEVVSAVKEFGIKKPVLSASKIPLRIDMPFDEQFDFPWHQDYGYNLGSENSVTVWIPLQDTREEHGALEIIEGNYLYEQTDKRLLRYSENGTLESEEVKSILSNPKSQSKIIPVMRGEILIFSQFLVHRSGKNVSNSPRMSIQVRFSDLTDQFFKSKKYLFSKNHDIYSYSDAINYLRV
jgi:ectoine hydroxylase-related dioxygenase (phytanoyl-CoA dioxygenase family)